MFNKWLFFLQEPSIKVLEIGSGSGFFTNKLLQLFPQIELTCLEPDEVFTKTLNQRFGRRIKIVKDSVEAMKLDEGSFEVVITHIVVHNLVNPLAALSQMARVVRTKGRVVTIEPLPSSRHYYPSEEIEQAFDFLRKATIFKCSQRQKTLKCSENLNPWYYCYPRLFEKAGLTNIRCHGWTSVFTLSDSRYDFKERKKWIKMRTALIKKLKPETTRTLLQAGETEKDIQTAYRVIFNYFDKLSKASEEELNHIHEQEIVHRLITIGQKP